jgi:hypothetical protein
MTTRNWKRTLPAEGEAEMKLITLLAAIFVLAMVATGDAEQGAPSVSELQDRLKVGRKIYVTEQEGREITGRFTELTPDVLVVMQDGTRREIPLVAIRRIQRPDPLWTGALIGAGIGGAMALTIRTDSACPARSAGCLNEVRAARVGFPLCGGLIGLWLDWLHDGRKTIYRTSDGKAVGAVATVAPGQRAFVISIIF